MPLPPPTDDSLCLVTGASSGTGAELARGLAKRGYAVAIVARRREKLDALADDLRHTHGARVDVRVCDLADTAARARLVSDIKADGRFVVGLCNDAGCGTYGRFQRLDPEGERQQVRVNVDAVVDLVTAFLPDMVSRGTGAILNIGSLAGFQPLPGNVTYGATKAFVNSFSEGLHADLAGTGVSCTVVCPGPVATGFFEAASYPTWLRAGPAFLWSSPTEMAEGGIAGMLTGKRVVIPRLTWKVAAMGGRVVPRAVLLPVVRAVFDRFIAGSRRT
jgi:short-subunit dehydrogenase